jgi:hypothetical protein
MNFQLPPWSCVISGQVESQYRRALSAGNTARSRMYMHFQKLSSFISWTAPLALVVRVRSKNFCWWIVAVNGCWRRIRRIMA